MLSTKNFVYVFSHPAFTDSRELSVLSHQWHGALFGHVHQQGRYCRVKSEVTQAFSSVSMVMNIRICMEI